MSETGQPSFPSMDARSVLAEAGRTAEAILSAARAAGKSEEQLIMGCDGILRDLAQRFGLRWDPRGERRVVWPEGDQKRRGSIDRLFDRVVVEFEPPGSLYPGNEASTNQHALGQARKYMDALIQEEGWTEKSVAGVVTDGFRFIYCRYSGGRWVQEAPVETNAASVGRFLRLLLTFQRPPLLPDALLRQFGADSEVTAQAVTAFYEALTDAPQPLSIALFRQWQDYFADIAGLSPETLAQKKELIRFAGRIVGREAPDPAFLLFALYTYSALLTKLLAVVAVTPFFNTSDLDRIATWAAMPDDARRDRLRDVESGEFYRSLGVRNFTEGDFFGWYVGEWTPAISAALKRILEALSGYDPDAVEQAPERVRDLLKRLYHGLFPRAVRHDLGEYYTPDWLAERLLAQLDNDLFGDVPASQDARQRQAARVRDRLTKTRVLDPACGSGTFLVLVIRRLRQWARECGLSERDVLLPALLENVIGFDLNPLAAISARANYLLAIGDLIHPEEDRLDLPVYLADSIVLPPKGNGADLFDQETGNYRLPLRGVNREFVVPEAVANKRNMEVLAQQLHRDLRLEVGRDGFVALAERLLDVTGPQYKRIKKTLGELYDMLHELHAQQRNGIWADIARNMFMPLFLQKVDFVVGNPPWVNWESLPQEYRERSRELWVKYGLFGHSGYETILGKGKKDVSTLMTYTAADLYLRTGGRLGFVITQSVFKTAAGQGFRRFQLGGGEELKIVAVDDFSALQPFEGATNRTAAFVLQKGQPTTYPVTYNVWRKSGRGSVPFAAHMDEALAWLKSSTHFAEPVHPSDQTSSWLTASRPALRAVRKAIGQSAYVGHAGAYSGGANGVYWLEVLGHNPDGTLHLRNIVEGAKREVPHVTVDLESDLLFPLLRERQVKKWRANPDPAIRFLIAQDPKTRRPFTERELASRCPRTLGYLKSFESILRERRSQAVRRLMDSAPWAMFAVSELTFAPFKVVWGNIASRMEAAVVESPADHPIVPQHTITLVAADTLEEAHYLCALANSTIFDFAVRSYSEEGGKSFGTPHVLQTVRIPKFAPGRPDHARLAELSRQAHDIASGKALLGNLAAVEQEVDECAARVWGLTDDELQAIRRSLAE